MVYEYELYKDYISNFLDNQFNFCLSELSFLTCLIFPLIKIYHFDVTIHLNAPFKLSELHPKIFQV